MYKNKFDQKIKLLIFVFLLMHFPNINITDALSAVPYTDKVDPLTAKWSNQANVQNAAKQLTKAYLELKIYVQKIYSAYAPYTIGEGELMHYRIDCLTRLVTLVGNVESIFLAYCNSQGSKVSYSYNIEHLKKHINFYYIDQELRLINTESTVVRQLAFALESLCDPRWHPDFIKATKFDKNEAMKLIKQIDQAINAAIATIPGGLSLRYFQ